MWKCKTLKNLWNHLKRNGFSFFLILAPLVALGNSSDIKLLLLKYTVACTGCLVFHIVRKQMFPYIDLGKLLMSKDDNDLFRLIAVSVLFGFLGYAIITAVAGGI